MTSRAFLNVAHATLVEEFMRPRVIRGVTVSGLSLEEALETAGPWAEGYVEPEEGVEVGVVAPPEKTQEEKTEEEIVAQNQRAMQQLQGMMSGMRGGFSTTKKR